MSGSVTAALLLVVSLTGCAPQPPAAADGPSLSALDVERRENWLRREIRRFRSYPHLDRAFRLMAEGGLREAKAEMEQYLAIDPDDLRVRFHYLALLHRLGAYADVIREADTVPISPPRDSIARSPTTRARPRAPRCETFRPWPRPPTWTRSRGRSR